MSKEAWIWWRQRALAAANMGNLMSQVQKLLGKRWERRRRRWPTRITVSAGGARYRSSLPAREFPQRDD